MKIADIIVREGLPEARAFKRWQREIQAYIEGAGLPPEELLTGHASRPVSPAGLHRFFRNREREENTCRILQYLLLFIEEAPGARQETAEPERQLHGFVRFKVDLLKEKDVRTAILREYSQLGILKAGNFWYYEGRIDDMHKELSRALAKGHHDRAVEITHLCHVLEKLCLFWFDICREDVHRVRRCDMFIYKLALMLRKKMAKTDKS